MSAFIKLAVAAIFATLAAASAVVAAPDEIAVPSPCLADWSDAAPIVARERLLSARDVREHNRRANRADVVRITLCREGAHYIYRLVLRDQNGRMSTVTMNAHAMAAE